MAHKDIVNLAEEYISKLFREKLSDKLIYHNYVHTIDVVTYTKKIGKKSDLSEKELEIVTLAAWFHDSGYSESYAGHEDQSKAIAENFLKENSYPEENIQKVLACIEATRMPQNPHNLMEEVICDADLVHFGREDFFEYSDLLKTEWESLNIKSIDDSAWNKLSVELLSSHKYFTAYARRKFKPKQTANLLKAKKNYKKKLEKSEEEAASKIKLEMDREKLSLEREKISLKRGDDKDGKKKIDPKKDASKTAARGVETMFRNIMRTHVEFSAMADSKANIMISINTLIIGIIVTTLLRKLVEYPYLTIPTFILLAVCLICIVCAVFVTRPSVTTGMFTNEDIEQKRTNLLFFGNFFKMPLSDFQWGMDRLMNDKDYLYGSMVKDFYFLGQVLGRKYKYLRICYTIFMYGLIFAVIAY